MRRAVPVWHRHDGANEEIDYGALAGLGTETGYPRLAARPGQVYAAGMSSIAIEVRFLGRIVRIFFDAGRLIAPRDSLISQDFAL
jgi:hypothetical protein